MHIPCMSQDPVPTHPEHKQVRGSLTLSSCFRNQLASADACFNRGNQAVHPTSRCGRAWTGWRILTAPHLLSFLCCSRVLVPSTSTHTLMWGEFSKACMHPDLQSGLSCSLPSTSNLLASPSSGFAHAGSAGVQAHVGASALVRASFSPPADHLDHPTPRHAGCPSVHTASHSLLAQHIESGEVHLIRRACATVFQT